MSGPQHLAPQRDPHDDFISRALDSAAIVMVTDASGTITEINRKFCELTGHAATDLIGKSHRKLGTGAHDAAFLRAIYREIRRGRTWHGEICNHRANGSPYWVDATIVPHMSARHTVDRCIAICFDITERKRLEKELRESRHQQRRIANLDPLTNLPNRCGLQEYIESCIAACRQPEQEFSLALLDVDAFKEINDSFGHPAGDAFLRELALRLHSAGEDRLFLARLGGDEFGLIHVGPASEVKALFERVLERVRSPIRIGGTLRRCSASLGIAVFRRDGTDWESLFKAADLALYQAKALGRDRAEMFEPRLKELADRKAEMLAEIEKGLQLDAFEMHYQPIVPLDPNRPIALEALLRWQHPQRGILSPSKFQAAFTDSSMLAALGLFMLDRVFRDLTRFREMGIPLGRVGINLTNSDFRSDVFVDRFFDLVDETGTGPEHFCIEVTEGSFLGTDQKRVEHGLRRLHAAGAEVALDDFGTGYASLTHLQRLPIDRLKIDRSFVANITTSAEDQAIVRGIIEIAHSLGKTVTAEGVETAEQARTLSHMGCDMLQGWHFGKACAADRFVDLVASLRDMWRPMRPVATPAAVIRRLPLPVLRGIAAS